MKKWIAMALAALYISLTALGCESMGRAAAKTEKAIKKGAKKVEQGIGTMDDKFEKGYEEEKNK